ncbi:hypothetical protein PI95_010220 [Hassallia byssoidea VB512170]|uniref:Uncharacterized protein n=1 Tax=Hassallia byssoidea VB512170 TaxID=1304833 RepID=A0A846H5M1_9CYAN|nr:hypothetical protein [Hassalia byssoidea]NEU72927.1 hypothetical protein [Hassalia byssoidea VB512170]
MKDNLSLIVAAAGGFMLSVALTGILRGAPVTSLQAKSSFHPVSVAAFSVAPQQTELEDFRAKT